MPFEHPIRIFVLDGTDYEVGHQQGTLLYEEIATKVKMTLSSANSSFGMPIDILREHARAVEPRIPKPFLDEIHGIADGAKQDYLDILCLNTFVDLAHCLGGAGIHCVSYAARPAASEDQHFYYGRNLDFRFARYFSQVTALFVRKAGGGRTLSTISVGGLAQIGFLTAINEKGMTSSSVSSHCTLPGGVGMPLALSARLALQSSDTLDDMVNAITSSGIIFACNFLLADPVANRLVELELSPDGSSVREVEEDWTSIGGLRKDRRFSRSQLVYPVDVARQIRVSQLLSMSVPGFSQKRGIEILRDRVNLLDREGGGGQACVCSGSTIYSLFADLTARVIWITLGPPPAPLRTYRKLNLDELFALGAGAYTLKDHVAHPVARV